MLIIQREAAALELRYQEYRPALDHQFSRAFAVEEGTHVLVGALAPLSGMTWHSLTVKVRV